MIEDKWDGDKSKENLVDRSKLSQVVNYLKMHLEINIKLGNEPPKEYVEFITTQIQDNHYNMSGLSNQKELGVNLQMNISD